MDRLHDLAATAAVLERARGVVMALTGRGPDAAHDELLRRAEAGHRTLLEECWITLGSLPAPRPGEPEPAPPTDGTTATTATTAAGTGVGNAVRDPESDDAEALGRLGRALVRVRTAQDLAPCLLEHLAPGVETDAVMIYALLPTGGLELVGHAGLDETTAERWRRMPPLGDVAALDALQAGEPRWLEDIEADRKRYRLVGDPPERWRSRAWLPVVTGGPTDYSIGFLRRRDGPFDPLVRTHLREVTRLCVGRLHAFQARREPVGDRHAGSVQTVFDTLPGTVLLLTPDRSASGEVKDFRIDAATPEAVDAAGRTGRELVGLGMLECWPAMGDESLWPGCLRALGTGEPYEGEPFARHELVDGVTELSTYSVRVARLGDGLILTWLRHAPSDRQEQRLADVQRLGNLGWANWNLVTHEATWSSQAFAVLDRDPAHGPVPLAELPGLAAPEDRAALSAAVGELLGSGRPFDLPFGIRTGDGVRYLRAVAEAVADGSGTPVEVHGFVQDLTAQRSAELALVASERAMLTQHGVLQAERSMAGRLQHALLPLPRKPVELAGLRVEVAYLPAQSGLNVGGDWFSAIELPDGEVLFVVGDVTGHGIDAVASMAQLRFTAKGMIITGSSLTGALSRLNALLLHSRDPHGTATMILARYDPAGRRLLWAQAGHPPPLLLRDGTARHLGRPGGMLLGASNSPVFEEAECPLQPGDRILLYTDGLVERPRESLDRGLERLARAVETHRTGESGSLEPLLASMLEGERRDDVCVVDIRVPEDSG
ncbi:SpoIIE family protein phosphatase [Streptomyces sp. NPDC059582]|uniref:SpoIIE family protein phosphatase n=1 Tax=Streptomyces sp. NPDC059582 TaxID=3346875 RepID=UPI0036A702A6